MLRQTDCLIVLLGVLVGLGACSGSSSGSDPGAGAGDDVHLIAVHQGKLVDVYGLRSVGGDTVIELYRTDVLVGLDIADERDATSTRSDAEILYDFLSPNPDTLQPRLLITREIGSDAFRDAYEQLDRRVSPISPDLWGRDTGGAPYSVAPRNAALRLTFSGDLRVTDDDFYVRDETGRIIARKNKGAVRLLEILGDPTDGEPDGDFRVVESRLAVRGNQIILDPVLLGTEGLIHGSGNTATGLPASPDRLRANIRLAIALQGESAIPGLALGGDGSFRGRNDDGFESIVRDFRSGNDRDDSPHLSRGFLRDSQPPRLVGHMLMYLAEVEKVSAEARSLTIFKDGIEHEFDRGDVLRIDPGPGRLPIGSLEILEEPEDDFGKPDVAYVRVLVHAILGPEGEDVLEQIDPSNIRGYPPPGPARDTFLRTHAPPAVLIATYTHRRPKPGGGGKAPFYGDDPRNFIGFDPPSLAADSGVVVAYDNVSPFAGALVRFTKPVDMATLSALETAFFATRNVLDRSAIDEFIESRRMDPASFNADKFRTPHLIHSRVFDQDGSQTTIRIQPTLGFYLDETMRLAAEEDKNKPFHERRYHYFLHLVGGPDGLADLSGNPLDFQSAPESRREPPGHLIMEFGVDARFEPGTRKPRFADNLVAYVVRRFADLDEDERPSFYLPGEVKPPFDPMPADGYRSQDMFGPIAYFDGMLGARPASRVTKILDSVNQLPPPPQSSTLRWCPENLGNTRIVVSPTGAPPAGMPMQDPLNPYGCRLQVAWREIDMSLSRTDPLDFNLDVEQMYWAPFAQTPIYFDEFDRVSLFLGHSEFRPESCMLAGVSGFAAMPNSGLQSRFALNYVHNVAVDRSVEHQPARHPAYVDEILRISAKDAILDPTGQHRFLPLPRFEDATNTAGLDDPLFVWRDERIAAQGGESFVPANQMAPYPYMLSPFLGGLGRKVTGPPGNPTFNDGRWHNASGPSLTTGTPTEHTTQGVVGPIALPLLADFWTYPDSPLLPASDPFLALGVNGWQVSLLQPRPVLPGFRAFSSGRGGPSPVVIGPGGPAWEVARGGYTPTGAATPARDATFYWVMADFLKRTTVVTSGFVEITNPHRMPVGSDPRLGPYPSQNLVPEFIYDIEPRLAALPAGTSVAVEFSGASVVDRQSVHWPVNGDNDCDVTNFPLDPLKAGDAWIRKFDDRGGRNWWTYLYNRTVTSYTTRLNQLVDPAFTSRFSEPSAPFTPQDVKYFNWRFLMKNDVESDPPVSPKLESFAVSYRLAPAR